MTFEMNPDKIGVYQIAAGFHCLRPNEYRSRQNAHYRYDDGSWGPCASCVDAATMEKLRRDVGVAEGLYLFLSRKNGAAAARTWRDVLATLQSLMLNWDVASILSCVMGNQNHIIKNHGNLIKAKHDSC